MEAFPTTSAFQRNFFVKQLLLHLRAMLSLSELSIQRSGKYLLEAVDLVLAPASRVAVVGANGCGKSTLFSLLLGELSADAGDFKLPGGTRIGHMAQETPALACSALDYVLDGDRDFRRIQQQIAAAEREDDGMLTAKWHQAFDDIGGYSAELRAAQLLEGLGFRNALHSQAVADFSGGWRVRLNLAQALMCPSDLLLLDEPTNHLDLDALVWLENWLLRYEGTLVFISHDRDFIDHLATHVLHFERKTLQLYTGNYSQFEVARAARMAQQQQLYLKQQHRISEIESFVRRFGSKATKAKQAQSRLKELSRLQEIAPAHVDSPFSFTIPCHDKLSSPLLVLNEVDLGYDDKTVLSQVALTLLPGIRLGILGANGQGKSTLVKALAGELAVKRGKRIVGEHLRVGYFAQHQLENLDVSLTPLQMLQQEDAQATEQEIRNFLGGFGFPGNQVLADPSHFSGGERARLALALIAWNKPNLLLLDEPTNHLDLDMRHALNMALQHYPGAVIVVSHDRHLLRVLADQFVWIHDGCLETYEGSLDEYETELLKRLKALAANSTVANDDEASNPNQQDAEQRRQRKRTAAAKRQLASPLKKQLNQLEKALEKLQLQQADLAERLADNSLYEEEQKDCLKQLLLDDQKVKAAIEATEAEWLDCMENLEGLDTEN